MPRPINPADQDSIARRARALPDALPPPTDLWPGIERKLTAPVEARWTTTRLATAAIILIAFSSTFTLWMTNVFDAPAKVELATAPPIARFGPWFASGTDIVQTRADMLLSVEEGLAELSPETWEVLTTNLNNIDIARREINIALNGHPESELLQSLLLSTYTNEITLLTQIGSLTRSAQQRIKL